MSMGRLVIAVKKGREWINFSLPDGQEIKVLIRKHASGNPSLSKVIIDCPKDIKIKRTPNESNGNE